DDLFPAVGMAAFLGRGRLGLARRMYQSSFLQERLIHVHFTVFGIFEDLFKSLLSDRLVVLDDVTALGDGDRVLGMKDLFGDADAVHLDSIGAAQVLDDPVTV